MTQPVFDPEAADRLLARLKPAGLRVFIWLLPLVSARLARYLHHEVPGITVPEALLRRLESEPDPAGQEKIGLDHALSLLDSLKDSADGLYLITPGARWSALLPLLARIREWRGHSQILA